MRYIPKLSKFPKFPNVPTTTLTLKGSEKEVGVSRGKKGV